MIDTRNHRRDAFTLMEILLVLAILVVVSGLAVLAITGPLRAERLRQSGLMMRAEWNQARVNAMRSGRIYVFRFQSGTGIYTIEPWFAEDDFLEAGQNVTAESATSDETTETDDAEMEAPPGAKKLPDGVVFHGASVGQDRRSMITSQRMENSVTPQAGGVTLMGSSAPILFYPDGTSSNARLILSNENQVAIAVDLRGLTGIAKVSPVVSLEATMEASQ
ncbi:MAG: prepilin-type N-terminal cleavage/methylation domain-containing protein [bacterium]|nr:prepilin-type N-terminal cleavage/methylation domain-containing protein [bacterium]